MAEIALTPIHMLDASLLLPTDDYAASCSAITLTPTPGPLWRGLKPASVHQGKAQWTLDLTFAQDHETADSLATTLLELEGTTIEGVTVIPDGDGTAYLVDVVVVPGAIGGQQNQWAAATVRLPVKGTPEPVIES
jgi:hypothetical protein